MFSRHMMWGLLILGLLGLSIISSGCVGMILGPEQDVTIETNPTGAKVTVDGKTAVAPATMTLKKKGPYLVTASKEGYETKKTRINSKFNFAAIPIWLFLDPFTIVGGLIDFPLWSPNPWYTLERTHIYIELEPAK